MENPAMANTKQQTVALYPSPGVGHIVPMVHLAKLFLRHGFDVTILLAEPPSGSPDHRIVDVGRLAAANPAITFHVLPPPPDTDLAGDSGKPPFLQTLELLQRYNDELERFLLRAIPRQRLHSLVTGMFSTYAVDVAARLRVPVYTFFASAAAFLAVVTQLPGLLAGRREGLKALGDAPVEFVGVGPAIPASHLVREILEHPEEDAQCKAMVDVWKRIGDTDGVLVNTFEKLETRAVEALRGLLALPPIYCVGPLVGGGGDGGGRSANERHVECLAWLDAQPSRGVVFLCFGSRGTHSAEQLREIAAGLDKSGHRFLWTVRRPAGADDDCKPLDALLPDGFRDRTKARGLVVDSWAPQVDVLRHSSTGAFVTHCGWNSTLEAVTAGVPMLCWPLHAEQMFNKVLLVEQMRIGVEMDGYKTGFVKADEVDAKVRLVMEESEEGMELRARAAAREKEAEVALGEGGSSLAAFVHFLAASENLREQLG